MNSLNFLPLFGTGSDIIKDPKVNILKIFIFNVNFVFFFARKNNQEKRVILDVKGLKMARGVREFAWRLEVKQDECLSLSTKATLCQINLSKVDKT